MTGGSESLHFYSSQKSPNAESILASRSSALGSILSVPKNLFDLHCSIGGTAQNSGQRLDSVNGTHLVLVASTLIL